MTHMDSKKLDFLVIGAQKCATSWLYYQLRAHPDLRVPKRKQEIGYIGGKLFCEKGEDWFFERFPKPSGRGLKGDVSVDYMIDLKSAPNIAPYVDKPRLIVVLRHPVDRMVSAYFWCVRVGQLPYRPLNEALKPFLQDLPEFSDRYDPTNYMDLLVRRGLYAQQLAPFIERFGEESLLVLLYDEIKADSHSVLKKVYGFIGVDTAFKPSKIDERPKVNSYNPVLIKLQNAAPFFRRPIDKLLDHLNRQFAKKSRTDPLDPCARERLQALFLPSVIDLGNLLKRLPESQRPANSDLQQLWFNR